MEEREKEHVLPRCAEDIFQSTMKACSKDNNDVILLYKTYKSRLYLNVEVTIGICSY